MPRHLHFTKFLVSSFALHAFIILAALFLIRPDRTPLPVSIPVDIIDLPKELLKKVPPPPKPVPRPRVPPRPIVPEKLFPPTPSRPDKFGDSDELSLPKKEGAPRKGTPEGPEQGNESGKTVRRETPKQTGPLPFLSQNDIDDLARKGFPKDKLRGGDVLDQETEEYRLYSYERWLFPMLTKNMRFPELAAITGLQGNVFVRFEILKDGSLGKIEIIKSSGYKILDDEAVRTLRDSAPFQPLPPEWNKDKYIVHGVAIFRINERYMQ